MRWGREGTHGEVYGQFSRAVKGAEAKAIADMSAYFLAAGRTDWRAAKAFLESRCPEDWGANRREPRPAPPAPVTIHVHLQAGQQLTDAIPAHLLPVTREISVESREPVAKAEIE